MNKEIPPLSPEASALLEQERRVPDVSAAVRTRAMARARAAMAAGRVGRYEPYAPRSPRFRWAIAAALLLVASAAVGAAAYQIRSRMLPSRMLPSRVLPSRVLPSVLPTPAKGQAETALAKTATLPVNGTDEPASPAAPAGTTTGASTAEAPTAANPARANRLEASREELRLLRRARVAVARNDFAAAMAPIAEHTRRFRDGRLAEEREALRVKSLAGLGRVDEARRAAAGFKARFPHSVLLPAVSKMPTSEP